VVAPLKKYAFINAKLRARLSKILTAENMEQLVKARSLIDTFSLLRNTPFETVETIYNKTGDIKMGEKELLKQEINLHIELEKHLKGELLDFVKSLVSRYEIYILKFALRLCFDRIVRKRDINVASGYLLRTKIHYNLHIDDIINADDFDTVASALKNTPYFKIIDNNKEQVISRQSIFPIEIELDQYFYSELIKMTDRLDTADCKIAKRMIGVEIDLQNINWLVRFKNFYNMSFDEAIKYSIPSGYNIDKELMSKAFSSKNISELFSGQIEKKYPEIKSIMTAQSSKSYSRLLLIEQMLEQIMMYEVRHILMGNPFTIGIMLSYFILKRNEIRKIMTILNAKIFNMDEDQINSLL